MNKPKPSKTEQALPSRRVFLAQSGLNLGALALYGLLRGEGAPARANADSLLGFAARPHVPPKAKSIIYMHMVGAPSQLDLFDYKPGLRKYHGEPCPESFLEGKRFAFLRGHPKLAASPFSFKQHGQSGQWFSELLPYLSGVADELAVVRSMQTDEFNHAPAQLFLHTGFGRMGRPSFGSWTVYGLGAENRDMPAYVVLQSGPLAGAGSNLWSAGFLPSVHQAVQFRSKGDPVLFLSNPKDRSRLTQRRILDTVNGLNRRRLELLGDPEIETRISQYEMAFNMQASIPELMDISGESTATLELYGAEPGVASFANHCLLARRLVEKGVRVVQLFDADWDHHSNIQKSLPSKCRQVDQAMAALILDLKCRGLLEDTLVVWGSEFGRTPMQQTDSGAGATTSPGRDHHKDAYTFWMAGGGIRNGVGYGLTDDFGYSVAENPVHVHDLNATILHLMGLDHEKLTFKYQGRDFRLTDVHGSVIRALIS